MSTVEWKKLWEVTTWDKKFNGVEKHMQPKTISYPYVLANYFKEIEAKNGNVRLLSTGDYIGWTTEELAGNNLCNGEIVAIPWGGYANIKYYNGKFVTADNRIATSSDKNKLVTKYLYYFFCKNQETLDGFYRGAGIKHPSMRDVLCMEIPLPDVDIQQAIVNQLDTFTTLISRLESELELRQKQYEHYREVLLNFEGDEEVEWKTIGSIAHVEKGNGVQKSDFTDDGVGCIHYGQIYQHYSLFAYKTNRFVSQQVASKAKIANSNDIIMTSTSENIEDICKCVVWLGKEDIAVSAHAAIITTSINPKYFAYCTLTNSFFKEKRKYARGAKVVEIKKDQIESILIPVPKDMHRQEQIVSQLDTFEQLIAALKREIALRKKQYEYYREKLLTFDE